MAEGIRWRKAVVISLLMHGVILIGGGYITAKTFAVQDNPEEYMELELVTEPGGSARSAANAESGSMSANDGKAVTTAMAPKANTPVVSKESVPSVQTFTTSMSVLSAETNSNISGLGLSSGKQEGGAVPGGIGTNKRTGAGPGSGIGKTAKGGGIIFPAILSRVEPIYPEHARKTGLEGTVVIKIQILENGHSGHVNVYRSSGSELLDSAAVAAVQQWRFTPAKERETGQAVVCYTTMPVVFRLKS